MLGVPPKVCEHTTPMNKDMLGVLPKVYGHTIPMKFDASFVYQRPYQMNPKYALLIQEENRMQIHLQATTSSLGIAHHGGPQEE